MNNKIDWALVTAVIVFLGIMSIGGFFIGYKVKKETYTAPTTIAKTQPIATSTPIDCTPTASSTINSKYQQVLQQYNVVQKTQIEHDNAMTEYLKLFNGYVELQGVKTIN